MAVTPGAEGLSASRVHPIVFNAADRIRPGGRGERHRPAVQRPHDEQEAAKRERKDDSQANRQTEYNLDQAHLGVNTWRSGGVTNVRCRGGSETAHL
jgi:hypothetical protein